MTEHPVNSRGDPPLHLIRADYSADSVIVYQAYASPIATAALRAQRFVPPFRLNRMTWIKPSFLWMMYRSDWGRRAGQQHVLRIELQRTGFDWALEHGVLTHFVPDIHETAERWREMQQATPVLIQWDPERDLQLQRLGHRTVQIGLRDEAIRCYAQEWILSIKEVTDLASEVRGHVNKGELDAARDLLPMERVYPVDPAVARRLGITT